MPTIEKLGLYNMVPRSFMCGINDFFDLSESQSDWRMHYGAKCPKQDIFATLLGAKNQETGQNLTQQQLISEAGLLVIAAMYTTASAITATIFYILHYSKVCALLKEEIGVGGNQWRRLLLGSS